MQYSLVFLAVIAFTAASPTNVNYIVRTLQNGGVVRNSALEQQILDLLEEFRGTMITGSDDVPVLDPLVVENLVVDENDLPIPELHLTVKDAVVTHLSTFVVEQLAVGTSSLIPLRYRATFQGYIPDLDVYAAHYDISVPVDDVHIFGRGEAKINIIEPRVIGNVVVAPTFGIGSLRLRVTECRISFNLKRFEPQITGLLGDDPAVDDFVNAFLSHLVPDLLDLFEDDITDAVSQIVMDIANDILADLNLFDILN